MCPGVNQKSISMLPCIPKLSKFVLSSPKHLALILTISVFGDDVAPIVVNVIVDQYMEQRYFLKNKKNNFSQVKYLSLKLDHIRYKKKTLT